MRVQLSIVPLLLCATLASGQTGVTGIRPLAFGAVLPGFASTIAPTNPSNSGQLNLTGTKSSYVFFTLSLPTAMTGPGGASLPLSFGASSGGYSATQSTSSETAFDPRTYQFVQLSGTGRGSVFVGGTASPAANQVAGSYSATLTLSATFF